MAPNPTGGAMMRRVATIGSTGAGKLRWLLPWRSAWGCLMWNWTASTGRQAGSRCDARFCVTESVWRWVRDG